MDVKEKLVEIVKMSADYCLPSNTEDFHLDMFVTALLSHSVTVHEWISVNDERKPKHDDVTLCYMHSDQYLILKWDENLKLWFNDDTSYGVKDVAYWQIPQPPKGE